MPAPSTVVRTLGRIAHLVADQVGKVGPVGASRWLAATALNRVPVAWVAAVPGAFACNCCSWRGAIRLPAIEGPIVEFAVTCPRCGSRGRHRFLTRVYADVLAGRSGRCLWFAPETCLDAVVRQPDLQVERSDPFVAGLEHAFDLQDITAADASFDVIICNHVVEHVERDREALGELARILKPGGLLCLSVPMNEAMAHTVEFGAPDWDKSGHWRDYGADFRDRLPATLNTRELRAEQVFSAADLAKLGIAANEMTFLCEKPR